MVTNYSLHSQRQKPSSQQSFMTFLNAGGWNNVTELMMDGTSEMSVMNTQVYWLENPQIRHHKVHWVNRIAAQLVHSFHLTVTMSYNKGTNLIAVHHKETDFYSWWDGQIRVHKFCSLWQMFVFFSSISPCPFKRTFYLHSLTTNCNSVKHWILVCHEN